MKCHKDERVESENLSGVLLDYDLLEVLVWVNFAGSKLKQKGFPGVFVEEFIENTKKLVTKFKVCNTGSFQAVPLLGTISAQKCFLSQPIIICSKLTIETLEQDVKYVQS